MKMKKVLAALLCVCMLCALLPTGAAAAVTSVRIAGASAALTATTPYYFNGGTISASPTSGNGNSCNAYFDAANSTLHLNGLNVSTSSENHAIEIEGSGTLYIELEDANTVTNSKENGVGIYAASNNLVISGSGSLTISAAVGHALGIHNSTTIKLQYPAELTVIGAERATDKKVEYIDGAYDAKGGSEVTTSPTGGYTSGSPQDYKYITFTPKITSTDPAEFPVWVGSTQVTSTNMANVLSDGKVSYAYAHGNTPATLTLDGASIYSPRTSGVYTAGIYAENEPLEIHLIGANAIETSASNNNICGIYSEKALTITADVGATLTAVAKITSGGSGTPYSVCSGVSITLDNCEITAPAGATLSSDRKNIDDHDIDTMYSSVTISRPVPPPVYYPSYYSLSFVTNGGGAMSAVTLIEHSSVDLAKYVPTREGYTFTGWYSDPELTESITDVTLSRNTTVYAGWKWINPFADAAETDWFYKDVSYACVNGLMQGTGAAAFAPHGTVSRAMVWQVLYNIEGGVTGEGAPWYADAQKWAEANGISDGTGADGDVTREQLVAMLYRYAKLKGCDVSVGEDTNILSYNDAFDIYEEFIPAVQWACGAGLLEGDAGNLMPQGDAERCQLAAILHRFCEEYVFVD